MIFVDESTGFFLRGHPPGTYTQHSIVDIVVFLNGSHMKSIFELFRVMPNTHDLLGIFSKNLFMLIPCLPVSTFL